MALNNQKSTLLSHKLLLSVRNNLILPFINIYWIAEEFCLWLSASHAYFLLEEWHKISRCLPCWSSKQASKQANRPIQEAATFCLPIVSSCGCGLPRYIGSRGFSWHLESKICHFGPLISFSCILPGSSPYAQPPAAEAGSAILNFLYKSLL